MSVVKSANTPCNTKAGLKGTIEYIFAEKKTKQELCFVTGDYMELEVTPNKILRDFMETKELFGKTDKRQCKQFIISWHEDSPITHEEALEICKEWAEKAFPDFTCAIAIHTDRKHVHGHVLVNSVSYVDGTKYHMDPWELTKVKEMCDEMNMERGFSVTEKGKHFDGTEIEPGTIRSYDKKTFVALGNPNRESAIAYIAAAILDVKNTATSKEAFIQELELEYGITTSWEDGRKYITFTDTDSGIKVRNNKLGDTVTLDFTKEALLHEFERNKELQNERANEKAKLDEGRGVLEERIREITGKYATPDTDHRTAAEKNSTVGGNSGNCTFREWPVERLARKVADNEQQTNRLVEWGKNTIRKLGAYLNRFRNSGSERKLTMSELEWEARQVAERLEERRIFYIHNEYDLKTFLLPIIARRPDFKEDVDKVYRQQLTLLDDIRYELNNTDPIILILAQSMRPKLRAEHEAKTFQSILMHEECRGDGLTPEESKREFLATCKESDEVLKDVETAIDKLCVSRGYEKPEPYPVMRRGRHC